MARFFLTHPVESFDKWLQLFDDDKANRTAAGLSDVGVYRKVGDENSLLIVLEGNPDSMKKMLASPELAEAMKEAGVLAPPEVFSGEKL
ncbi:MAG: hypothetical protein IH972_03225 [Candidatus Marinimicrobia bacterium]|nr:hypothetical protein [Candidatus Neomarinimicrobiota bacterium]